MEVLLTQNKDDLQNMEWNAAEAALVCHDNVEMLFNGIKTPDEVLKSIIKLGHESVLEHIIMSFKIERLSRACLQELARHRHISLCVESSRHTLKQKFANDKIFIHLPKDIEPELEGMIRRYVQDIFDYLHKHPYVPNDHLKYAIPECLCTNLIMTVNLRELRHIIGLRIAPQALEEFRGLCAKIFEAIPQEFQYLLEDKVLNGKKS